MAKSAILYLLIYTYFMRYFLQLSYFGKNFCGWQRQENAISVQVVLEEKLSILLSDKLEIVGCGRTDAGVHAHEYFAHFDTEKKIASDFLYRLNAILPTDIAVQRIIPVSEQAHARFDATARTYKYFIHTAKNPFIEEQSFFWNKNIDLDKMNRCLQKLLGEHDFSAFEKKGSDNKTSVCVLTTAYWQATESGYVFTITANRFLRNMVRRMTAALLQVGNGTLDEQIVIDAVLEKKALDVRVAVPAKGLFLWMIEYDFLS